MAVVPQRRLNAIKVLQLVLLASNGSTLPRWEVPAMPQRTNSSCTVYPAALTAKERSSKASG